MKCLSIIIVNWNGCDIIKNCLESIFENIKNLDYEVIVVDNNSADSSPRMIKDKFPSVNLIELDKNYGFAKANNIGISKSSGKYIVLLNSDTTVKKGSFEKIIEYMDKDTKAGIVGPKLVYGNGDYQYSYGRFPTLLTEISGFLFLSKIPMLNAFFKDRFIEEKYDCVTEVDWISGACLFFKRDIIEKTTLLDEQFFMYMEDIDFCLRAKSIGWKVMFYPFAEVVHLVGRSVKNADYQIVFNNTKSYFKYYKKYFNTLSYIFTVLSFFSGTMIRILLFSIGYIFTFKNDYKKKLFNNIKILKAVVKIIFTRQ